MLACPFSYQPSTLHSQAFCTLMPRALPLLWIWNYYVWQWYNRGWFILRLQSVVFCSLMQTGGAGDCTKDLIHGWCLLPSAPQTLNTKPKMTDEWMMRFRRAFKRFFLNLHKFFTWLSMPMDEVLSSLPSSQLCFQTPRRSDNEPTCMCAHWLAFKQTPLLAAL